MADYIINFILGSVIGIGVGFAAKFVPGYLGYRFDIQIQTIHIVAAAVGGGLAAMVTLVFSNKVPGMGVRIGAGLFGAVLGLVGMFSLELMNIMGG